MIHILDRGTPEGNQTVAGVFVQRAAAGEHRLGQTFEKLARKGGSLIEGQAADMLRVSLHVGDQRRHVVLAGSERILESAAQYFVDDDRGDIVVQRVQQLAGPALRQMPVVGDRHGQQQQEGNERPCCRKRAVMRSDPVGKGYPCGGSGQQQCGIQYCGKPGQRVSRNKYHDGREQEGKQAARPWMRGAPFRLIQQRCQHGGMHQHAAGIG